KEVVQLFISDLYASVTPDVKRLRGFEKISLNAGESKKVSFTVKAQELAFVAKDLRWTVEEGEYAIQVGNLKETFNITKDKAYNTVDRIF
ncbi:MAG: beta-glucosidase, partial [Thalassobius sp.]|nr:beta-glucosidase [Thalassovita sp.]